MADTMKEANIDSGIEEKKRKIKVYYDLKSNANISDKKKLQLLPSKEFSLDDTYTFKQLLINAAKFWKISLGAVESRSVVLVNREGKEWDLTGKVSYLLRAKLTDNMRGVILRYHVPNAEQEVVHEKKNLQMYDFNRVSNIDAFPAFMSQVSGSSSSISTYRTKLFETQQRLQQGPPPNYTAELWQIFAYYCVTGDPKELRLRMRSFIQFGHHCRLFRDQFTPEIMGVIYDENKTISHASMSFDQFLNALVHIACNYLYVPTSRESNNGDAIALGKLLLNDVLQYARKLSWGGEKSDWSSRQAHIDNYEVQALFTKLKGPLQKMFKHYAMIDGTFHRGPLSTMPLSLTGFRRFSREVGFWEIGIDAQDLAQVYFLTSTYHSEHGNDNSTTNDLHMLFYGTFLNAIGHCALLAFPRLYKLPDLSDPSAENDEVGPRVLKSLFQHMAWSISKIPADKRPSGGTSFVRNSMVMFRNVTKNGNADHLHMYKKIGVRNISEKKNINLSTHRVNAASKVFMGTSPTIYKGSNMYRSKVVSPSLESKHQNLIIKENYPMQRSMNKFSNDSHSMSGRYRVYDILSRTNVKRSTKSKSGGIKKISDTCDATIKERVMPSLPSPSRSGRYKSATKVNSASSPLNFSPTTTKIRLAMELTSETNVDIEGLISPQLAVRFASIMYGKGLKAELKHFHGNKWDKVSNVAGHFYQKGDANVLKVLNSLDDSDVESSSTNRILGAEEEKLGNNVREMEEKFKHFRIPAPLTFVKTRFDVPNVSGTLAASTMRLWGSILLSTAKRRVKQMGLDVDTPRLENILPTTRTPFLAPGAIIEVLIASLADLTAARQLFQRACRITIGNVNNKSGDAKIPTNGKVNVNGSNHFEYANALSVEACLLHTMFQLGYDKPKISLNDVFNTLLSACQAFAAANKSQGKMSRSAYLNNWAMNLFRLSDIEGQDGRELTFDEIKLTFPPSFIKTTDRSMFGSLQEYLLSASLSVLDGNNVAPGEIDNTGEKVDNGTIESNKLIMITSPSSTMNKLNNDNAIRFIKNELAILTTNDRAKDLKTRRRSQSRRKSRKQSITEWKKRPGTPVTPMLRRDSRTMSVDTPVQESEELLWTSRFVDYFTIVGRGKLIVSSSMPSSPKDLEFSPMLLDQFPKPPGLSDMEVPAQLPDFCFPNGVRVLEQPVPPTYFHFVLTDFSGTALYVTCIHFYDKMDPIEVVNLFRASGTSSPIGGARMFDDNNDSDNNNNNSTGGKVKQFPDWINLQDMSANPVLYTPNCLCLISHWGFFDIFKQFLSQIYRIYKAEAPIPIERYVMNFVFDIPLPPRGDTRVQYTLADLTLFISRPMPNELPLLNLSMKPLFQALSLENIVTVIGYLLCERSVVLCSRQIAMLTISGEALRALMFPFSWQAIYIPVLPRSTIEFLYSPVPFFMGICVDLLEEQDLISGVEDVIFVDLDRDQVHIPVEDNYNNISPPIPETHRKKLLSRLKKCCSEYNPSSPSLKFINFLFYDERKSVAINKKNLTSGEALNPSHFALLGGHKIANSRLNKSSTSSRRSLSIDESMGFNDAPIRDAFLNLFTSLFSNYRKYLYPVDDSTRNKYNSPSDVDMTLHFDKMSFLNENKSNREFLSHMMDTQLFAKFVSDRSTGDSKLDEITFFDESIINNAKSRGTFITARKKSTPLLDDDSHRIKDTFVVPAPNTIGLESAQHIRYKRFPTRMRVGNFGPARDATFLVQVSNKVRTTGATLRLIYRHDKRSGIVGSVEKSNKENFDEHGGKYNANSFREILSFINILVDHIVLMSIAEVQRRKIKQQNILVETLKNHILLKESVDADDDGSILVRGSDNVNKSKTRSERKRKNSHIVFEKNGNISIGAVNGRSITIERRNDMSMYGDGFYSDANDQIKSDSNNNKNDGKKFELLLRVKPIRRCLLPYLKTYEFTRLSICSNSLQKNIPEEKLLWKNSVRNCPPSNNMRGKFWMHCGGVPSFLNRKTEKGFYFKLVDKCHNVNNSKWAQEINFDVQHIEALLATSFNDRNTDDDENNARKNRDSDKLFRAADFKTALRNVLYAYITFDPDLGYCNGMCSLVGFILWWLQDVNPSQSEVEQRVFFLLLVIFRHLHVERLYGIGMKNDDLGDANILAKFKLLFANKMPVLERHFVNEGVDFESIYRGWFKTLFTEFEIIPPSTVARLWDIFFTEGWDGLMNCVIVLLGLIEDDLLQLPIEGILLYLRTLRQQRPEVYYVDEGILFDVRP
jgi:hypothetical protein